jgi:alpha-glucosidase
MVFSLVLIATLVLGTIPLIVADIKYRAPRADHGYSVIYVEETHNTIRAQLELNGDGPALYGRDIQLLDLIVEYQTGKTHRSESRTPLMPSDHRLHVLIQDVEGKRYQVPESLFPRPKTSPDASKENHLLSFEYTNSPFSFQVSRSSTGEVLFNVSATDFIFESQYLRLKTALPEDPNLYGLGEHFDSFRMPNNGYRRTFWGRDGGVWYDQNLYGTHPVYFEHRISGTHGVFLLNSNGMDINLDSKDGKSSLEYNVIGGVLDFYFLEGPSPVELSRQYAQVIGRPAMVPYWTLGVSIEEVGFAHKSMLTCRSSTSASLATVTGSRSPRLSQIILMPGSRWSK